MGFRPTNQHPRWALAGIVAISACAPQSSNPTVDAVYDKETGKLSRLTLDATKDGKPNITSYMDGPRFVRIEIDHDEDGKIDRWEYYGRDQKLEKVGLSRSNDGKPDSWVLQSTGGTLSKVQVSTKGDGTPNRTEFYRDAELLRAEEDTDGDGRADRWETYTNGALATLSLDLTKAGKPTMTIDYRK